MHQRIAWPFDGMCFDIEDNEFWMDEWGDRPDDLGAVKITAKTAVQDATILIPIYSHHYSPADPNTSGILCSLSTKLMSSSMV